MFAKIIKKVLKNVTLHITYEEGDLITIIITWHGSIVLKRTIDFLPKL